MLDFFYIFYILAGALCNCFSCINLLPGKLKFGKITVLLLFSVIVYYSIGGYMGQFSTFIVMTGLLLFLYHFTNKNFFSLSCALFGYLYSVALNYLFLWAAQLLLKMDIEQMFADSWLTSVFSGIFCLFCLTTTWLLGRYLHKKLKISELFPHGKFSHAIFIDLLLLSIFFIANFSYGERLGYHYGIIALNGVTFLLFFAITVYLLQLIYRTSAKEQYEKYRQEQFLSLQNYTASVEQSYFAMRKFKHDYINILSTFSEYLKEDNIEGLKEYYKEKIMPISYDFTKTDTKLGTLSYIKDSALKGLISSKLIYALETGIDTKIELLEPIGNLHMDALELSRILGIFLDNAIESARETAEKEITFCLFYKETNLHVIVQNTSLPLPFPISVLINPHITSKGEHRGLGLYQVSVLLKNYDNIDWNTEYKEPYFTQELIISLNEKET